MLVLSTAGSAASTGPFVGVSVGGTALEARPIGLVEQGDPEAESPARKLEAGYWLTEHFGVGLSFLELGRFSQDYVGGTFEGEGRSFGLVLLGRLPFAERWAIVGKLNAMRSEIRDAGSTPGIGAFERLRGHSSDLVLPGVEIDYALTDAATAYVELEPRGRATDDASVFFFGLGTRWTFP